MPTSTNNQATSFRGVRTSKFRHVYGQAMRKERCYENVPITRSAHDSNCCAVNPKFIAVVTETAGGGSFVVIPLEKTGRLDFTTGRVVGHSGPVLDVKWNPFNDNVIASCSEDTTIKIWYIPDNGLNANLKDWLVDLHGHRRRVAYLEWHPTAENILASAGLDHLIIIWNISHGEAVTVIDSHHDVIYSMSFNREGNLLATTCKDKKLRILDPRSGKTVSEGSCHVGSRATKVLYLGDSGQLFTTGFSRNSNREYALWSQQNLNEPLRRETIDSSSGVLFPFYDHDTRMIYVAGKGDGNIRFFEVVSESPWIHYLGQFLSGFPQRGLGFMPKRGCDTSQCEVFRFYKLHITRNICEPISMIVPRKSDSFQADLYPDTVAPTPAMSAEEWISGKNKPPVLLSMRSGLKVTYKPVRLEHVDKKLSLSERNNEKKFAFIAQENIVDYRPLERDQSSGYNEFDSAASSSDEDETEIRKRATRYRSFRCSNKVLEIIMQLEEQAQKNNKSTTLRGNDLKAVKTTSNLGTKFLNSNNNLNTYNFWSTRSASQINLKTQPFSQKKEPLSPRTLKPLVPSFLSTEKDLHKMDTPKSELELRRAYMAQREELKVLKGHLILKDKRIKELEEELRVTRDPLSRDSSEC
ncbi:coronin-2B-like isoform X1 [Artemia franciscana]|uniref:coronin-2B-like isoform X1 n=1 Tax=Artemia franciscana TaxID=6661 RepID=UPI0032DA2C75